MVNILLVFWNSPVHVLTGGDLVLVGIGNMEVGHNVLVLFDRKNEVLCLCQYVMKYIKGGKGMSSADKHKSV
jgi:hypothetical protein